MSRSAIHPDQVNQYTRRCRVSCCFQPIPCGQGTPNRDHVCPYCAGVHGAIWSRFHVYPYRSRQSHRSVIRGLRSLISRRSSTQLTQKYGRSHHVRVVSRCSLAAPDHILGDCTSLLHTTTTWPHVVLLCVGLVPTSDRYDMCIVLGDV